MFDVNKESRRPQNISMEKHAVSMPLSDPDDKTFNNSNSIHGTEPTVIVNMRDSNEHSDSKGHD